LRFRICCIKADSGESTAGVGALVVEDNCTPETAGVGAGAVAEFGRADAAGALVEEGNGTNDECSSA
jgi:hypothetical protein